MAREPKTPKKSKTKGRANRPAKPGVAVVDPNDPQAMQLSIMMRFFPTFARTFNPKGAAQVGITKKRKEEKPSLPIVNLLPPRLALEKMRRSTRRNFTMAGAVIVMLAGLAWVGEAAVIAVQQAALDEAKAVATTKSVEIGKYQSVKDYFLSIQARKQIIQQRTGNKVDYEAVDKAILAALPAGAQITLLQVSGLEIDSSMKNPIDIAKQCGPITDPFAENMGTPIACLTVNGVIGSRTQIPSIALALQENKMFANLSAVQSAESRSGITFTIKAVLTAEAVVKKAAPNTSGTTAPSTTGGNN